MHNYTSIMAVKNGGTLVRNAINSMLQQHFPPVAIIISDDGSDDGTAELVEAEFPQASVIRNKPSGQGAALNAALLHVKTDYIAILDHDDTWAPEKGAIQMDLFEKNPDIEAVYGGVRNIAYETPPRVLQVFGATRAFCSSTLHRSCFDRAGLFRTDTMAYTPIDWWSRATLAGIKTLGHDDVVLNRYIHGNNFGIREKEKSGAAIIARIREHQQRHKVHDER